MMRRAAHRAKTPEEVVKHLIHGLVRLERKWIGFDSLVREEILAHYKEGRMINDILRDITESPVYDYTERCKVDIADIPFRVKEIVGNEVSEIFYQDSDGLLTMIDDQMLNIEESAIRPYLKIVFEDEYKTDLKEWLDAMSKLEKKGYTRDEIMTLLYHEPINTWPNLARRIRSKITV